MGVQRACIKAGGFAGGEGVDLPADGVHSRGELRSRTAARTFKEHVLDKMRAAFLTMTFKSRPDADPDTDSCAAHAEHVLESQAHSVW